MDQHQALDQVPPTPYDTLEQMQQIDTFFMHPECSTQIKRVGCDSARFEPTIVSRTSAYVWMNKEHEDHYSGQGDAFHHTQAPPTSSTRNPSILEQYTQTLPLSSCCQSIQKRCLYPDCTKMSVSKGLCRGHGGGRRCHFAHCSKSAQSRSLFCWAHGGGQRCNVQTCRRSRKSKRYCIGHMHLETEDAVDDPRLFLSGNRPHSSRLGPSRKAQRQATQRLLPSLGQALSAASFSFPAFPLLRQIPSKKLIE